MNFEFERINQIFHIMCLSATIAMAGWCLYNYWLDEDLSLVDHKKFGETEDDLKPALSICLPHPFLQHKFDTYYPGMNAQDYQNFLLGQHWDEKMLQVDFEKVTINLDDYIKKYLIIPWDTAAYEQYDVTEPPFKPPYVSYIGSNKGVCFGCDEYIIKCYALNVPLNASYVGMRIQNDIFPYGIRPFFSGLMVSIHYPNQILRSTASFRSTWPIRRLNSQGDQDVSKYYIMGFRIKLLELTIRRKTRKNPCNSEWQKDDFVIMRDYWSKHGCTPPYKIWNSSLPTCGTKDKMKQVNRPLFQNRDEYPDPCRGIEKIVYSYEEYNYDPRSLKLATKTNVTWNHSNQDKGWFWIIWYMHGRRFTVILHKQAYDFQSFIGNSGGYMGLFLGSIILKRIL